MEVVKDSVAAEYAKYQKDSLTHDVAVYALGEEYIGQTSSATWSQVEAKIGPLNLNGKSKVLDVGCGSGGFDLKLVAEFGASLIGVDFSQEVIEQAKKVASSQTLETSATFLVEDFTKLDREEVPDGHFDLVLSIGSLYWNEDINSIISVWAKKLGEGGSLIVFANMQCEPFGEKEKVLVDNTKFIHRDDFAAALKENQLKVVEIDDGTETYLKWINRWCEGLEKFGKGMADKMGEEKFQKFAARFKVYRQLAESSKVKRLMITAEKTPENKS